MNCFVQRHSNQISQRSGCSLEMCLEKGEQNWKQEKTTVPVIQVTGGTEPQQDGSKWARREMKDSRTTQRQNWQDAERLCRVGESTVKGQCLEQLGRPELGRVDCSLLAGISCGARRQKRTVGTRMCECALRGEAQAKTAYLEILSPLTETTEEADTLIGKRWPGWQ